VVAAGDKGAAGNASVAGDGAARNASATGDEGGGCWCWGAKAAN